uniref:Uncharacterized protein n=1 Tax=Timema monikensis TaxID=170555 RepID=A0A7R9HT69_9NEOP|nr:unnamed protein product [Timema monikensis]
MVYLRFATLIVYAAVGPACSHCLRWLRSLFSLSPSLSSSSWLSTSETGSGPACPVCGPACPECGPACPVCGPACLVCGPACPVCGPVCLVCGPACPECVDLRVQCVWTCVSSVWTGVCVSRVIAVYRVRDKCWTKYTGDVDIYCYCVNEHCFHWFYNLILSINIASSHRDSIVTHCTVDLAKAKRDNAKITGYGGGKDKVFDEVDQEIFEILKSNVVVLDGLGLPESQSEDIKITELVLEPGNSDPQCSLNSPSDNYNRKRKFISLSEKKEEKLSVSAKREALKIKLLETELYYKKLKCLELEKKLGLPPSNITDEIIQEKLFTIDVSTDFVCEMLD